MIYLLAVFIASVSQIFLKKGAMKQCDNVIKRYLNVYVLVGYFLLLVSMVTTIYAYKGVALKNGPVIEATSYLFVAILSHMFLKEKINKKKKIGIIVVIMGIIISNL